MAEEGRAEPEQTETKCKNDDDELDALLDDALKDFEKATDEVQSKNNVKITQQSCTEGNVSSNNPTVQNSGDNLFELTNNMSDVLEKIVMDEPSLKAHFDSFQQKMESSSASALEANNLFNIDEDMAKTFEELTKNLQGLGQDGDDLNKKEFENMFKQMQSEIDCGEGDISDDDSGGFMNMMKGMMQNLLSKDLLYPSLKDIKDKYPSWLDANKTKISTEEYNKYKHQESIVCKLCQLFDEEDANDLESVKNDRMSKIVSLMEQMQEYGHPPADMMENIVCGNGAPSSNAECNLM